MTVSKFVQPDFTTQDAATYKGSIDASFAVLKRSAAAFAPRAQDVPDMTVHLDAGHIYDGDDLTELAAQDTGTITAPVTNPRIDRIVIDRADGSVFVVTGAENASPVPPALPAGYLPVAQVLLVTSSVAVTNSMIADERSIFALGLQEIAFSADGGDLVAGSVDNDALEDMPANTIKGNNTGGADAPEDLSAEEVTAMLEVFEGDSGTGGGKGLVPAPLAGDAAANKFLSAGGGWVEVADGVDIQLFTSSGTWTKPSGKPSTAIVMIRLGGGGGSGGTPSTGSNGGSGGTGGECVEWWGTLADLSSSETVTIGDGGAGVPVATHGLAGGNTTFGSLLTARGGFAGQAASPSAVTGRPGSIQTANAASQTASLGSTIIYGSGNSAGYGPGYGGGGSAGGGPGGGDGSNGTTGTGSTNATDGENGGAGGGSGGCYGAFGYPSGAGGKGSCMVIVY